MNRQIIVTGGLGYIGSHTIVKLKDYFDNSSLLMIYQIVIYL